MEQRVDLRSASYETFVEFLFDHPVTDFRIDDWETAPWYWKVEAEEFEPTPIARHYLSLFTEPASPLRKFSDPQLEQGFWAIQSMSLDCSAARLIWLPEIEIELRASVVRSMYHLFERFFSANPLPTASHQWWDSLAYDWHCGNRSRANGGDDLLMQDVMFATLARILDLPAPHVQLAALHGLGHLHHPDTNDLIEAWLKRVGPLEPQTIEYARAAACFEVM
jgi:hypothetical protein